MDQNELGKFKVNNIDNFSKNFEEIWDSLVADSVSQLVYLSVSPHTHKNRNKN